MSDHPVLSEIVEKNPNEKFELLMIYKYGFDGCGSFQTYMQRDESGWVPQDASTIIFTQMVPLSRDGHGLENRARAGPGWRNIGLALRASQLSLIGDVFLFSPSLNAFNTWSMLQTSKLRVYQIKV